MGIRARFAARVTLPSSVMAGVLSLPVLVLNRYFVPIQVTSSKRAFILLYSGTAQALDECGEAYDFELWRGLPVRERDHAIPIIGGELRVPRVLHLHLYDRTPRGAVRLTRRNLMYRDAHQCQYCGKSPPLRDLNIDHVVPRSRGGGDSWENLVTSCKSCNVRKGRKTPEEANMRLARNPFRPKWSLVAQIMVMGGEKFAEWEPFLKAS